MCFEKVRIVFDAEAGAVLADADVEDADGAEPAEQVDWVEQYAAFGLFGGVGVEAGEENIGFGKWPAGDVAFNDYGSAEVFRLLDDGMIADDVARAGFAFEL